MKIEFYKHNISPADREQLLKVLDSIFITTGPIVSQFEKKFAQYTGNQYAVAVMSCTHALELALRYYNIGAGDEVITTPMSFVATANVIEYVGATPVFVDVEATTGNIDADLIEKAITPRTKAIMPVHLYGQMCDMIKIKEIAQKYNLKIIEDCAHCIEGSRDGIQVGQLGDAACYSFYATKNLTCGEGGAITCNDTQMYEWFIMARSHGISKGAADRYTKKYEHYDLKFLGLKCNLTDIQAALLLNQIDSLDLFLSQRESLAQLYDRGLQNNHAIGTPAVLPNSRHARHLYTIWTSPELRDVHMHHLQEAGIGVAVNFRTIHLMEYYIKKYGYKPGAFPVAEKIGASNIALPLYPQLTEESVGYIVDVINGFSLVGQEALCL
jgi:dTDP-4-amino-4,6-dideoxygalactose transaminase